MKGDLEKKSRKPYNQNACELIGDGGKGLGFFDKIGGNKEFRAHQRDY
jgi:hypothetical protein